MAEELLSSYVDRAKFKSDTDFIIDDLTRAQRAFESVSQSKIAFSGASVKEFAAALKQAQLEALEMRKRNQELTIQTKEFNLAQKQAKAAIDETTRATKSAAKAATDSAKERERERKIIGMATDEYFNLNKALVDAEKKYKNYFLTLGAGAKETQTALKEAVSLRKILNEIDQNLGNYQRNVGNYSSAFNGLGFSIQNILRETPSLANSMNTFFMAISNNLPMLFDEIQKVNAANKAAAEAAKVAAVEARAQAEATAIAAGETKAAAVQAGLLAEQQALANAEQVKAPSLMKQISSSLFSINTLLTVSVLALTLFGSKIADFVGGLFKSKAAIDSFKLQMEDLNKALESTDFKNAVEGVEKMRIEIDLAKQGFLNKKAVVDEYNKTLGQTLGQVNSLEEAERRLTEGGEAYIKMTLYKAAANLALEEAAKKTLEAERIRLKAEADFANSALEARINAGGIGMGGGTFNAEEEARLRKLDEDARKARKAKAIKIEEDAAKQQTDIAKKFLTDAAKLSAEFKFDFFGGKDKSKVAGETKQSLKEILDAAFEIYKIDQQRKIRLLQEELSSDNLSYDQRIAKLQEFSTAKLELITRERENEIRVENEKLANINANLKKAKGTERENLLAEKKNVQAQLKIIDAKYNDETQKVFEDNQKKFTDIQQKEQARRLKLQKENFEAYLRMLGEENSKRKAANEAQYVSDIAALQDAFKLKQISQKEFQNKSERLNYDFQRKQLESEIAYAAQLLLVKKFLGQNIIEDERKLIDLRKQLQDLDFKQFQSNEDRKREEIKKTLESIREKSEMVFGIIGEAINAIATAQKNRIQEERDAIEKKAARDIELVNASAASEEEKAAKIAIINARAQNQKEELDRRNRQIELEKARFDKAQTIFRITLQIAEAIASANFFKAAIATAQLAIAIATPLPRFKHGLKHDYEGPAVVGDGGKAELIRRKDGTLEITPATDTLTYIQKGDRIEPDANDFLTKAFGIAHRSSGLRTSGQSQQETGVTDELKAIKSTLKAIERKPVQQIQTTERGLVNTIHYGASQIRYVQDNCDF